MPFALATFEATPAGWTAPPGAACAIDLRPLPEKARRTHGEAPYALFFYADGFSIAKDAVRICDSPFDQPRTIDRDAWEALIGYRPQGATLIDWLFDQLTAGSDPAGLERPSPLMPGSDRLLRLYLPAPHAPSPTCLASHKHRWGDRFTNRIAARLHADFRRQLAALERRETGAKTLDQLRRELDYLREAYRPADVRDLLPSEIRATFPEPLPHATTHTESFPTNSTTISSGQNLAWSETSGDSQVASGVWCSASGGNTAVRARANADVSGVNHYAQAIVTTLSTGGPRVAGVLCRFDSGAESAYQLHWTANTGNYRLGALTGGSATDIGTGTTQTVSLPATIKVEADGSTIRAYFNGALVESLTDTTHAGNTRGGLYAQGNSSPNAALDSYQITDLAVGPTASRASLALLGVGR